MPRVERQPGARLQDYPPRQSRRRLELKQEFQGQAPRSQDLRRQREREAVTRTRCLWTEEARLLGAETRAGRRKRARNEVGSERKGGEETGDTELQGGICEEYYATCILRLVVSILSKRIIWALSGHLLGVSP